MTRRYTGHHCGETTKVARFGGGTDRGDHPPGSETRITDSPRIPRWTRFYAPVRLSLNCPHRRPGASRTLPGARDAVRSPRHGVVVLGFSGASRCVLYLTIVTLLGGNATHQIRLEASCDEDPPECFYETTGRFRGVTERRAVDGNRSKVPSPLRGVVRRHGFPDGATCVCTGLVAPRAGQGGAVKIAECLDGRVHLERAPGRHESASRPPGQPGFGALARGAQSGRCRCSIAAE